MAFYLFSLSGNDSTAIPGMDPHLMIDNFLQKWNWLCRKSKAGIRRGRAHRLSLRPNPIINNPKLNHQMKERFPRSLTTSNTISMAIAYNRKTNNPQLASFVWGFVERSHQMTNCRARDFGRGASESSTLPCINIRLMHITYLRREELFYISQPLLGVLYITGPVWPWHY